MYKTILIFLFLPTILLAQNNYIAVEYNTERLRLLAGSTYATLEFVDMSVNGFTIDNVTGTAAIPGSNSFYAIMELSVNVNKQNSIPSNNKTSSSNGLTKHATGLHTSDTVQPSGGSGRYLVLVQPVGGKVSIIGQTGNSIASLSMHPNGTLYGVSGDGGSTSETLYTIDTNDGSLTMVMALGNGDDGEAIGFHPNGTLYHSSGHTGSDVIFESIDLGTLTVTNIDIDSTDLTDEEAQELLWSSVNNAFIWKQDHGSGPLFLVNTDASSVTQIADLDFQLKGLNPTTLASLIPRIPSINNYGIMLLLLGLVLISFNYRKFKFQK